MKYQNNRLMNERIYEVDKLLSNYEEYIKSNACTLGEAITMPLQETRQTWAEFRRQFDSYKEISTPNETHKMQESFEKFEKNFKKVSTLTEEILFSSFRSNLYQKIQTLLCQLHNFLFVGSQYLRGPGYFISTNRVVEEKYTITTCRNSLFKDINRIKKAIPLVPENANLSNSQRATLIT